MVMAMRLAGNEEGGDGKAYGIGDKGGMRRRGQWQWQQERSQQGWRGSDSNEGDGNGKGNDIVNGNRDEAGGWQRGKR
jgi:hypothetical protein